MSSVPLSVQKLTKRFEAGTVNEKLALDGLSLEVPAGQFVTVLGSNGSGKSTLFNAILGKILPDSGRILLGGGGHHSAEGLQAGAEHWLSLPEPPAGHRPQHDH